MKNYIQDGDILSYTHNADVASGELVLIGSLPAVACGSFAANVEGEYALEGVYDLPAAAAATGAVGAKAYWDATAKNVTSTADDNTLIGAYWRAKLANETVARVRLSSIPA